VTAGRILVIDDTPANVKLLVDLLSVNGFNAVAASSGVEGLERAASAAPDLILLDVMMPDVDGFAVCERLKAEATTRDVPVIFLTALHETAEKVRAFSAGGVDYVTKPFEPRELLARVGTHVALRRARLELEAKNAELRAEVQAHQRSRAIVHCLEDEIRAGHDFLEIVGRSPALMSLLDQLALVAGTDSTVLVLGETGTGKELVARAMHDRSRRRAGPLVKVNCAALPRELVESELFGHEKGAFTGATQQRRGRFELAASGTLFLDEVGELSLEAQAKLLRVLQEGEFERVGGTRTLRSDARLIAATNRDLGERVGAGAFREDLFYRLNVFPLTVPPLRERRVDIPDLVARFVAKSGRKLGRSFDGVAPEFLRQAMAYDWPGNVRELQNAVERAAILSRGTLLEACGPWGMVAAASTPTRVLTPAALTARTLLDVERDHIRHALEKTEWVIEGDRGAALALGVNPSTLRGRMRKLGIRKASPETAGPRAVK
jgi:DNA-binding NtrC family response regulator